jgi:hypothetical protein
MWKKGYKMATQTLEKVFMLSDIEANFPEAKRIARKEKGTLPTVAEIDAIKPMAFGKFLWTKDGKVASVGKNGTFVIHANPLSKAEVAVLIKEKRQ